MTPLVAALVRAVVWLLTQSLTAKGEFLHDTLRCECEPCRLLRDVEREAET